MSSLIKANLPAILFFAVILILLTVFSALYIGDKYGDSACTCTGQADMGWRFGGSFLALFFLLLLMLIFVNPAVFVSIDLKSKWMSIVIFLLVGIVSLLGWSLYGRTLGDATCTCRTKADVGWDTAGSVMAVFMCLFIVLLFFTPGILFKNPTEAMAKVLEAGME